jgi:hypothetical protein
MSIATFTNTAWSRHHDLDGVPIRPKAHKIHFFDTLESLIRLSAKRKPGRHLKATGSHWGLSDAALSDDEFIETNWPGPEDVPRHSGLDLDFGKLISDPLFEYLLSVPPIRAEKATKDPCLSEGPAFTFFVHIKSGTRVYETYSLLDQETLVPESLADRLNARLLGSPNENAFGGPWAFRTLGGAGGQTIFGALTTGTHGGDYLQRPISDSVAAIHLVADGGYHYWIEPDFGRWDFQITDDSKLNDHYGNIPGAQKFEIIRSSDIFDAVVVSPGRFGTVASLVLQVVPQYCLQEHRALEDWSIVKAHLKGSDQHRFFGSVYFTQKDHNANMRAFEQRFGQVSQNNRFLQIAVNLSPHGDDEHRCGVTQRWMVGHNAPETRNPDGSLHGREERGTFGTAGKTHPYVPGDNADDEGSSGGTFLSKACSNGNFVVGVIDELIRVIQHIIETGTIGAGAAVALTFGLGPEILALASTCLILAAVVAALKLLVDELGRDTNVSAAGATSRVIDVLLNTPGIPRCISLNVVRGFLLMGFEAQRGNRDFVALSYAVMDTHDYLDRSCFTNAHSIEVFFDADHPDKYCTFVDQVLAFEALQQETQGKVSIGYLSIRYVQGSYGLISPSRYNNTVVIEVAGIRDASGTDSLVAYATELAKHGQFAAPFHWGQFNPLTRTDVEKIYNSSPRAGSLDVWRNALRRLNDNGQTDAFSSEFTRRAGLEL